VEGWIQTDNTSRVICAMCGLEISEPVTYSFAGIYPLCYRCYLRLLEDPYRFYIENIFERRRSKCTTLYFHLTR